MEMYKRYKPELILDRGSDVSFHKYLYLDTVRGVVVATNGHMLIELPVETTSRDVSGYIQSEAVERARDRADEKQKSKLFVKAMKTRLVVGDTSFDRPLYEEYPDYRGEVLSKLPELKSSITFGVDMSYLDRLREALGVDANKQSTLFFVFDPQGKQNSEGGYEDPIWVFLQTEKKSFEVAIIMPHRWYNNKPKLEEDMSL